MNFIIKKIASIMNHFKDSSILSTLKLQSVVGTGGYLVRKPSSQNDREVRGGRGGGLVSPQKKIVFIT